MGSKSGYQGGNMGQAIFVIALALLISFGLTSCKTETKPNIIFILADDLGYMDIQEYAHKTLRTSKEEMFYETPNLDRLINEGVAFQQAYVNPLCSPTRASILTGKYPARLGFTVATPFRQTYYNQNMEVPKGSYAHDVLDHHDNIDIEQAWLNASTNTALPSGTKIDNGWDEITIPEVLVDYHSAFIGKWHIGGHGAEGYTPADQGFQPLAWYDSGYSEYFNWRNQWNDGSTKRAPNIRQDSLCMGNSGQNTGEDYLTDDLTAQALKYIDERSKILNQPFFLYFSHFAVHSPNQAKKEDIEYFENKPTKGWNDHANATYAGMLRGLDNSVGKILDKLEETGLDENTLVVFMSDNGGIDSKIIPKGTVTNNYPLTGGKACVTEGGIRVPLVFRWKGKIKGGKWSKVVVDCNDIFPTLMQIAGYDPTPRYSGINAIDGKSIAGLLNDVKNKNNSYTRDTRYWHYPFNVIYNSPYDNLPLTPHSAIMQGDYKLIFDWYGRLKLFNIKKDISESNNLVKQMPEKTNELFAKLMAWLDENVKDTYLPKENSDYDKSKEPRKEPFINLIEVYKQGGDVAKTVNLK